MSNLDPKMAPRLMPCQQDRGSIDAVTDSKTNESKFSVLSNSTQPSPLVCVGVSVLWVLWVLARLTILVSLTPEDDKTRIETAGCALEELKHETGTVYSEAPR
jgi:hypothetical protein